MTRSNRVILGLIILFGIIGTMFFFFTYEEEKKESIFINTDLIERQEKMDKKIADYTASSVYTIEKPKIIINPFEISPLTALIIFKTPEEGEVQVYLNDKHLFTTDKKKSKCIPITGLLANANNKIKLIYENKTYEHEIHSKIDNIPVSLSSSVENKDSNSYYFMSSSTSPLSYSAYNGSGKLIWHLNMASQGTIHPLDDSTFLVSAEESVNEDNISHFTSLYVINYLGKIERRIETPYGYHHDIKVLSDGTALVLGTNKEHPMSILYRINLTTGEVIDTINFYDIFKSIDPTWDSVDKALKYGYGMNSIDYKENTKELLVSFRGLNLVMSLNYETKAINWMYSNELEFFNFSDYMLLSKENIYPIGQHEARFVGESMISLYNNNYDEKNSQTTKLTKNVIPATALILNIDQTNKTISVNRSFTSEKKNSYALGGFKVDNNSYLINYAYLFKDEAIQNEKSVLDYENVTYSHIVEYDNAGNTIFDASIADRIYRVDKHPLKLYTYNPKEYQYVNFYEETSLEESKLKEAPYHKNFIKFSKNYYEVLLENEMIGDLTLILVGEETKIIPYKGDKTYYDMKPGSYAVYVKFNDKYYNLDSNVTF